MTDHRFRGGHGNLGQSIAKYISQSNDFRGITLQRRRGVRIDVIDGLRSDFRSFERPDNGALQSFRFRIGPGQV